MALECPVCCEDVHVLIKCVNSSCKSKVCITCAKRYILSCIKEPHCMACETRWTYKFLNIHFPKTWLHSTTGKGKEKSLRDHFKKVSIDREKSRIPDTMAGISRINEQNNQRTKRTEGILYDISIKRKIAKLSLEKSYLEFDLQEHRHLKELAGHKPLRGEMLERYTHLTKNLKDIKKEKTALVRSIRQENDDMNFRQYGGIIGIPGLNETSGAKEKEEDKRITYVFSCFGKNGEDDCRGLVESKSHKCAICEQKYCRECRQFKGNGHVCKKEDVDTVKMIKEDTKPCPKCRVAIFKISGCEQMFCTNCHTAFDWRTLRIETGGIHNPHYFEWMAERGRNGEVNDRGEDVVRNGGCFQHRIQDQRLAHINYKIGDLRNSVIAATRKIEDYTTKYTKLREDYILGVISEEKWQKSIFLIDRGIQKARILEEVYETARTIGNDIIRTHLGTDNARKARNVKVGADEKCLKELETARVWINDLLIEEMNAVSFNRPKLLDETWDLRYFDNVKGKKSVRSDEDEDIDLIVLSKNRK